MEEFKPGRNQDASATIRGFVYQVELTILRWLGLGTAQILQLERGEDIDHITKAGLRSQRLLEQVKDVQRSLTLHVPGAVIAIASFCAHRQSNPARDLWFRYTTTAPVGREKLSPLPSELTGIEAWEQLRRGEVDQTGRALRIGGIRSLLRSASRPPEMSDALWGLYRAFAEETDDQILVAVSRLEWSFGNPGVLDLAQDVVRAIRSRCPRASDAAEVLHDILFAAVFRTLSQPGIKELTVTDLEAHLASPQLTESDRTLLLSLRDNVFGHAVRLFSLENRVEALEIGHRALRDIIDDAGTGAKIAITTPLPVLSEPPLVRVLVDRAKTVLQLKEKAGAATWIAISGGASTGKSHLAGLLARSIATQIRWFALRGIDPRTALDRVRFTMQDRRPEGPEGGGWAAWVEGLPCQSVLVLDDLGPVQAGSAEAALWIQMLEACKHATVRLITTGVNIPPAGLVETIPVQDVRLFAVPMFDDDETRELLSVCGAPAEFSTNERITVLRGLAGGHPVLLRAVAGQLAQKAWHFDSSTLATLLAGGHAQELSVETSRRVFETVTRQDCRELLYRLCVVCNSLTLDDVRQAASLPPAKAKYLECVQSLDGLWLQPAGVGRYEISPLVLLFGAKELEADVASQVHRFAGRRLLRRGAIDRLDSLRAVLHFVSAEDHNQAVSLIVWGFTDPRGAKVLGPEWPLLFYPPAQPFPPALLPGLGMAMRGQQVVASRRLGRDGTVYWESLLALMERADDVNRWGTLLATNHVLSAGCFSAFELIEVVRQLERIGGRARALSGEDIESPGWNNGFAHWLVTAAIKSWDEFWSWLKLLESLDAERRHQVLSSPDSVELLQGVIDRLWIAAAEEEDGAGSVPEALEHLSRLENWAVHHNVELMAACAIRGQMVIAGEYQKRYSEVETLAQRGLRYVSLVGPARALVELTHGTQLELAGEHEQAIPHLKEAVLEEHDQSRLNRVFGYLAALEASFASGRPSAEYAEAALRMLESVDHADIRLKARALAEIAVSRWSSGRKPEAFDAMEAAITAMLGAEPTKDVQSLTVRLGHALGYFMTIAITGAPPQETLSGDAYVAPTPSMFRGHNAAVVLMYRSRTGSAILKAQLAALASRVDRMERSAVWAESSLAEAVNGQVPAVALFVAPIVLDAQIRSGDTAAAIETGFVAARALRATNAERQAGRDPMRDDFKIDLHPGPPSLSDDLDEVVLQFVAVPIVLRICEECIRGREAGITAAQVVINAIARLGRPVLPSDKWSTLASLLQSLIQGADEQSVAQNVQHIGEVHQGMLQLCSYLLLGAWPGFDLGRSALLQSISASTALQVAAALAPGTSERLADYVESLWRGRVQSAAFKFGLPAMLARDIEQAAASATPEERIRAILRSVTLSLDVRVSESARKWLDRRQ